MSDIRKYFKSRFGNEGFIVEADFSQLELIVLAVLSGDPVFRDDLINLDMHIVATTFLLPHTTYKDLYARYKAGDADVALARKKAKRISFQLTYGAGYKKVAEMSGVTEEEARLFILNYYNRYRGLKEYQNGLIDRVNASAKPSDKFFCGTQLKQGRYESPTNRQYIFYHEPSSVGRGLSFSPTKIKNYMTQGTATGDIVPLAVGDLYRALYTYNEDMSDKENVDMFRQYALLVNTVHDSVVLDVHKAVLDKTVRLLYDVLQGTRWRITEIWKWDFTLPLKCEVKVGRDWGSMEVYKPIG